jgi:hypothetical protein
MMDWRDTVEDTVEVYISGAAAVPSGGSRCQDPCSLSRNGVRKCSIGTDNAANAATPTALRADTADHDKAELTAYLTVGEAGRRSAVLCGCSLREQGVPPAAALQAGQGNLPCQARAVQAAVFARAPLRAGGGAYCRPSRG